MIVVLMAIGVPVAITFLTTNIIGWLVFNDWNLAAIDQVVDNSTILITRFTLGPVLMFILMGSLFFHTGLAVRVFDALDALFGQLPGRLAYLTVAGGSVFSTLTSSSMANTAMLGSLMVPEMNRRGYNWRMSMGPILGIGDLAMIIPPSALGVLLAAIASIDVGRLLIAGAIPGFHLAGQLGLDLVWFGLFVLITIEIAGTTTPFGLLLYVMLGVAPPGTSLFQVANAGIASLSATLTRYTASISASCNRRDSSFWNRSPPTWRHRSS